MAESASPDKKEAADGEAGAAPETPPGTDAQDSASAPAAETTGAVADDTAADDTAADQPVAEAEDAPAATEAAAAEEPAPTPAAEEAPAEEPVAEDTAATAAEEPAAAAVPLTKTGDDSAPEPTPAPPAPSRRPAPGGNRNKVLAIVGSALSVALVLLVVFGVLLAMDVRDNGDDDDKRKEALAAAEQAMVNLSSVKAATAEADVQRVLDSATGQFSAEFRTNKDAFIEVVKQAQVDSSAEVDAAGIQNADDGNYRVLVALTSSIKNATIPQGEQRPFRMAVTMAEEGGDWKVDRVEYIP